MSAVSRVLHVWIDPALSPEAQATVRSAASALAGRGMPFAPVKLAQDRMSLCPLSLEETRELGSPAPDVASWGAKGSWLLTTVRESTRPPFVKTVAKIAKALEWRVALVQSEVGDTTPAALEGSHDLLLRPPPPSAAAVSADASVWAEAVIADMDAVERKAASPPGSPSMLRRPVLSICVTTYNRGPWIAHSLPLILEQAAPYRDIVEVVVCDNASTDDTPKVAAALQQRHAFSYHRNDKNVGMLGNLGVSCDKARGEYVWVIGDDDLMVEGTVERVLSAVALYPRSELIYTNYAFTRFNRPEDLQDVTEVIRGARAISSEVRDEFSERVSAIAAKSENCFTAIYCLIFRRDHARGAYHQDTSGKPFSSLLTSVPTAYYVCRRLFDRPGYWIGDPCVVVNMNVSWMRYASLFILERFPELFDLMQERGVEAAAMDGLRSRHVPQLSSWFREIYLGRHRENLPLFSAERLIRRFGHLPAFRSRWPELHRNYQKAFRKGAVEDPSLTPERLQKLFSDRSAIRA